MNNGFYIIEGDEVNSILIASLRSLNMQELCILRDKLIARTQSDIELKSAQEWYASKLNKQVSELDEYDLFCAKVAYDYAVELILKTKGRVEKMTHKNQPQALLKNNNHEKTI